MKIISWVSEPRCAGGDRHEGRDPAAFARYTLGISEAARGALDATFLLISRANVLRLPPNDDSLVHPACVYNQQICRELTDGQRPN
jgi:hypothetical protein